MTLSELNLAIIKWAEDRQILKHSTAYAQAFKTAEEVMELVDAVSRYNIYLDYTSSDPADKAMDDIRDAIGDIWVTLVVGAACSNNGKFEIPEVFMPSVSDPVLHMQKMLITIGATAKKDKQLYWMSVLEATGTLNQIAEKYDTTLEACVNQSYLVIKDRKGHLNSSGVFVKEEA